MILERIRAGRTYWSGEGLGPFLVRAVAGSGAVQMGAMLASFMVGVQLARGLGVAGYGYYGFALAIVTTAGIPGEMGLPKLVMREVAAADARSDRGYVLGVLRFGTRLASLLSAAMALIVIVAAALLQQSRPSPLVLCLLAGAPVIPFMALAKVDSAGLRALNQVVRGQVPAFLLKPLAMSLLLFIALAAGLTLTPWIAMATNALTAGAAWLLTRAWLNKLLPRSTQVEQVREGRHWFASMVPMALTDGMRMLQTQLSILILGVLATAGDVGLFRIAVSTAVVLMAPQAVIVAVVLPLISRLYVQKDMARLQLLLARSAQVQFGGVMLLSLPLLIAPGPILSLVYGAEYAPAANVLRIVLFGQLVSTAFGMNAAVLNMTRHERRVTRAMAGGLVLNAASIALLLPIWGISGAAVGFAMSMLAWNVLAWIDAWRLLGIDTSFLGIRLNRTR